MQHITDILVYKNRCEVVDEHTFGQGDTGTPQIRLKFMYMFETTSLSKEIHSKLVQNN